jgi:hypothetical protein
MHYTGGCFFRNSIGSNTRQLVHNYGSFMQNHDPHSPSRRVDVEYTSLADTAAEDGKASTV